MPDATPTSAPATSTPPTPPTPTAPPAPHGAPSAPPPDVAPPAAAGEPKAAEAKALDAILAKLDPDVVAYAKANGIPLDRVEALFSGVTRKIQKLRALEGTVKEAESLKAWFAKFDENPYQAFEERFGDKADEKWRRVVEYRLNKGKPPADEATRKLEAKLAEIEERDKKRAEAEEQQKRAAIESQLITGFMQHFEANAVSKYEHAAQYRPEEIRAAALTLARSGKFFSDEEIGGELERLARMDYERWEPLRLRRAQSATTEAATPTPSVKGPSKTGNTNGAASAKPKALTQQDASERSEPTRPLTKREKDLRAIEMLRAARRPAS